MFHLWNTCYRRDIFVTHINEYNLAVDEYGLQHDLYYLREIKPEDNLLDKN
jgi:hypothetical protein